ncbi:MAG TPA: metal ABC transporter substrate-binding protein, partial [Dehalococcoidia bacterium]|nr:metal ABC transporter substrate-binding protein [Dehalococcoidia bacterium]
MRLTGLLLIPWLLLVACSGGDESSGAEGRLRVVATTTQIGDFTREVGGDRVSLTVLLKPNQDAHDFELAPSQVRAIAEADLVLVNGLGLDAFVEKALESSEAEETVVSEGITPREGGHHEEEEEHEGEEEEEEHEEGDPHIWFSVANARIMVENIRDALSEADSANAATYAANASRYLTELQTLDVSIKQQVAQVPAGCRKLVTNHDVLGYYAEAYGFEVIGSVIPSTSSQASASASDVAEVVRQVRAENVPAVFAEVSINPDLIRQVGREAGVDVVDDLYGDSLGPSDSDGDTYVEMMQTNTRKIVNALKDC